LAGRHPFHGRIRAGLGLAIVGGVAHDNNSTVEVRTGPHGSTFTLAFQIHDHPERTLPSASPPALLSSGADALLALVLAGGHAAVDQEGRTGDEFGLVACVEDRRGGNVAGPPIRPIGGTGQSPLSGRSSSPGAMCRIPGQVSPGQSTFERTPSGPPSSAPLSRPPRSQ